MRRGLFQSSKRRRGNALIEFALLFPMLMVLFIGLVNLSFYCYLFIAAENAARSAASRNAFSTESAVDQEMACTIVTDEMRGVLASGVSPNCQSAPLLVESAICDSSTPCTGTATSVDGGPAVVVRVRYTAPDWITLGRNWVVSRAVQMKLRSN